MDVVTTCLTPISLFFITQKVVVKEFVPVSSVTIEAVDAKLLDQAHLYVLLNTDIIEPFIEQHMSHLKDLNPHTSRNSTWLHDERSRSFISWIKNEVSFVKMEDKQQDSSSDNDETSKLSRDDPNAKLLDPPGMYPYLKKDDWKLFVAQRLSKKWQTEEEIERALL
ncbi:hypothetical protein L1887_30748 [Cichorium endivia]|nr:hypothetical protein L1887_30748 [Cichorium endivia]